MKWIKYAFINDAILNKRLIILCMEMIKTATPCICRMGERISFLCLFDGYGFFPSALFFCLLNLFLVSHGMLRTRFLYMLYQLIYACYATKKLKWIKMKWNECLYLVADGACVCLRIRFNLYMISTVVALVLYGIAFSLSPLTHTWKKRAKQTFFLCKWNRWTWSYWIE